MQLARLFSLLSDGGISLTSTLRQAESYRLPGDHRWVVVDAETSGLRAASHRVLSIAALVLREDGTVEQQFSTLLNPGCDPGPVHIHNLTPDRLAGAPRFEDIADEFAELLSGRTMLAHNASFDYGFLDAEFQRVGSGSPGRSASVHACSGASIGAGCTEPSPRNLGRVLEDRTVQRA